MEMDQNSGGRKRLPTKKSLVTAGLIGFAFLFLVTGCRTNEGKDAEPFNTGNEQQAPEKTPVATLSPNITVPTESPEKNNTLNEGEFGRPSLSSPSPTNSASTPPKSPVASLKPEATPVTKKQQIDEKYEKKFSILQKSCKAKVAVLSGEVKNYIQDAKASDQEVTVSDLKKNFMAKITAAEAGCDKSFNGILENAKQDYESAGLDPSGLDKWSQMYSQGKNEARRQALAQIIAAWKAGSN